MLAGYFCYFSCTPTPTHPPFCVNVYACLVSYLFLMLAVHIALSTALCESSISFSHPLHPTYPHLSTTLSLTITPNMKKNNSMKKEQTKLTR